MTQWIGKGKNFKFAGCLFAIFFMAVLFFGLKCLSNPTKQGPAVLSHNNKTDKPRVGLPKLNHSGVSVKENPGADWNCKEERGCECISGYRQFLKKAKFWAKTKTEDELKSSFKDIDEGLVELTLKKFSPKEFREHLIQILNIGFLLEEIERRPLLVTVVREEERTSYIERELLFEDPYVGIWKALFLEPKGPGPHPAIIALHGHGDSDEDFRDRLFGGEYPAHGYAILIPTFRLMCGGASEGVISKELLLQGHSLLGVRCYETLLALKFLLHNKDVDNEMIGLIGHSGGSTLGNILVHIEPRFRAYVSDNISIYHRTIQERGGYDDNYFDAMVAELYPYYNMINDFNACSLPVSRSPYGYRDSQTNRSTMTAIFTFFDKYLKPNKINVDKNLD